MLDTARSTSVRHVPNVGPRGNRGIRPHTGAWRLTTAVARTALLASALASSQVLSAQPSPVLLEAIEWYTGIAGVVDDARAQRLLLEAVKRDDPLARMWLARCHSRGRMGFVADVPRARALAAAEIATVETLAGEGVLEAVFLMATAFDEGLGRPEDPALAAVWLRRAAERGHTLAQHNLGNAHAAGRGVEQNDRVAVEWWLKAAAAGDAITQLRLGEAYEAGRGVAATWLRLATGTAKRLDGETPPPKER